MVREECGIFAIYSKKGEDVAPLIYRGLVALQHRGQDAAGFAVYDGSKIILKRGLGLASDAIKKEDLKVKGHFGIGHTRYPTIGEFELCDVQPSVFDDVAVAHNGHVANYDDLKKNLEAEGVKFESTVDSEPMVYILRKHENFVDGVKEIIKTFEGAFSDVAIFKGKLIVFRDRFALRPLVWGENEDYICFASESVALAVNGIPYKGEINGGELAVVNEDKVERTRIVEPVIRHCMFEYVYFSRPDSIINGKSVYEVRRRLGEELAKESPADADVVVPVPDTSRTAANAYAEVLKLPCREGLIKNRYIGRTFIMPSQEERINAVRMKLNPVREVVAGKRVVLLDDSIVRGTTLREIVSLVRKAGGAKEVHIRIPCPPIRAPCFYGVDIPTYTELIANKKSVEEIREHMGADSLAYISLEGLKKSIGLPVCTGCLTNEYHTEYVRKLAEKVKAKG